VSAARLLNIYTKISRVFYFIFIAASAAILAPAGAAVTNPMHWGHVDTQRPNFSGESASATRAGLSLSGLAAAQPMDVDSGAPNNPFSSQPPAGHAHDDDDREDMEMGLQSLATGSGNLNN
jgi:hypothetical protein